MSDRSESDPPKAPSNPSRYNWSKLNRQQVGTYAEYFVKMEFTMYGFQVFTSEVDDRGIDFVTRYENGSYLAIQVKSVRRRLGYTYMKKSKFRLTEDLHLAFAILAEGHEPALYLVPSFAWKTPNPLLCSRDYGGEGQISEPEWGLNLSRANIPLLQPYLFQSTIERLISRPDAPSKSAHSE